MEGREIHRSSATEDISNDFNWSSHHGLLLKANHPAALQLHLYAQVPSNHVACTAQNPHKLLIGFIVMYAILFVSPWV